MKQEQIENQLKSLVSQLHEDLYALYMEEHYSDYEPDPDAPAVDWIKLDKRRIEIVRFLTALKEFDDGIEEYLESLEDTELDEATELDDFLNKLDEILEIL
jgi:hypothetical protein